MPYDIFSINSAFLGIGLWILVPSTTIFKTREIERVRELYWTQIVPTLNIKINNVPT